MQLPRMLNPVTNPAGYLAAAGAVYTAATMIVNAVHGNGILDPQVIVGAVGTVGALFVRTAVTPVKDPHDGNGQPLTAPPQEPVKTQP